MAVDPQVLSQEQMQREAINNAGAPTDFAVDPAQGVKVAGSKGIQLLLEALKPGVLNKVDEVGKVIDPDAAVGPGGGSAPAVPTSSTMDLLPDGMSYKDRQVQSAPQVLSPPALEEFIDRGYSAFPDTTQGIKAKALIAVDEQEADEASILAQQAIAKSQKALDVDDADNIPDAALASKEQAELVRQKIMDHEREMKNLLEGGDFNAKHYETPEDIFRVITAVSEVLKDETQAITRGVITNKVTLKEAALRAADEMGLSRKLLLAQFAEDGGMTAANTVAVRFLLQRSAKKLLELAEAASKPGADAATQVRLRRQVALHAGIQLQKKSNQTEIARAQQSYNIDIPNDDMTEAVGVSVQQILDDSFGGSEVTADMAKKILDVAAKEGPGGLNRMTIKAYAAKTKRVVHEAYLTGLLWNPATQMKNIVGTASFMLYQIPAELAAGVYGAALRKAQLTMGMKLAPEQVYVQDALLRVKGWNDSLVDAWSAGVNAYRTELPGKKPNKIDLQEYAAISADDSTAYGRAINEIGKRIRIPFRLLLGADEFFKVISERGELYTQVNSRYNHMIREGMTPDQAEAEAGMLLLDPQAVANEIDTKAAYDTMTTKVAGISQFASKIQNFWWGRFILPFATAPTNSMMKLTEYGPLGFVQYANPLKKMTPKERQLMMGRATLGTATMYMFAGYAAEGKITGSMPSSKADREALPPNWRPYSFVTRGEGDWTDPETGELKPLFDFAGIPNGPLRYISYAGYEPVGAIIGLSADYAQKVSKIHGALDIDNEMVKWMASRSGAMVAATADYYKELPMLQGIADIVKGLNGRPDLLTRSFAESSTFVGFPNPASAGQRLAMDLYDPRKTRPRMDMEYYTLEDVEQKDENGQYIRGISKGSALNDANYALVGTPKVRNGHSVIDKALQSAHAYMRKDSLFLNEYDTSALVYDTLGREKKVSELSFAVNPVAAIRNRALGVRIEEGRDPSPLEIELMRLHHMTGGTWPLSNDKGTLEGIKIGFGVQSDWTNLAKNEVMIRTTSGIVDFRQALDNLINSITYQKADVNDKVTQIGVVQTKFYDAAISDLLQMKNEDGEFVHENLAKAIRDKSNIPAPSR